jgi:cell wall assembly regulator SMI1
MTNINTYWGRIEAWLGKNTRDILAGLAPGATDAEIAAAEKELGVEFPDDVRASYTRHNGQMRDKIGNPIGGGLIDAHEFLSLNGILDQWRVWKELLDADTFEGNVGEAAPGIKPHWWSAKWIPLTYDGSGNHFCLDLDPATDGTLGQIITMWHDQPERALMAHGFAEWLERLAQDMESGLLAFSDDYGGIVSVDDL